MTCKNLRFRIFQKFNVLLKSQVIIGADIKETFHFKFTESLHTQFFSNSKSNPPIIINKTHIHNKKELQAPALATISAPFQRYNKAQAYTIEGTEARAPAADLPASRPRAHSRSSSRPGRPRSSSSPARLFLSFIAHRAPVVDRANLANPEIPLIKCASSLCRSERRLGLAAGKSAVVLGGVLGGAAGPPGGRSGWGRRARQEDRRARGQERPRQHRPQRRRPQRPGELGYSFARILQYI